MEAELIIGKWYKLKCYNHLNFLVKYGRDNKTNCGFWNGDWSYNWHLNGNYILATDKEVEECLLNYAKNKYEDGCVIKSMISDTTRIVSYPLYLENNSIYDNDWGNKLFDSKTNKWAEIVSETEHLSNGKIEVGDIVEVLSAKHKKDGVSYCNDVKFYSENIGKQLEVTYVPETKSKHFKGYWIKLKGSDLSISDNQVKLISKSNNKPINNKENEQDKRSKVDNTLEERGQRGKNVEPPTKKSRIIIQSGLIESGRGVHLTRAISKRSGRRIEQGSKLSGRGVESCIDS